MARSATVGHPLTIELRLAKPPSQCSGRTAVAPETVDCRLKTEMICFSGGVRLQTPAWIAVNSCTPPQLPPLASRRLGWLPPEPRRVRAASD